MAQTAETKLPHIPARSFKTTYRLTQKNIANFYLHAMLPTIVAWGMLLVAGIVLMCFRKTIGLGIAVAVIVAAYGIYRFVRVRKRYKASLKDPNLFCELTMSLDADGFAVAPVDEQKARTEKKGDGGKADEPTHVRWLYLIGLQPIGQLYAFRLQSQQTLLVPKSAFDAEQRAWLDRCVVPYVKKSDKILAAQRKNKQ